MTPFRFQSVNCSITNIKKMQNSLKFLTGATGVAMTEGVQHITPEIVNEGVGLIGQLVIIIATLISLFRKKKNPNNNG